MDWKKASQIAQIIAAIPITATLLWLAFENFAKVDEVQRDLCIAEARSDLNELRLAGLHSYSRYINEKVNQAQSDSADGPIGPAFEAPDRDLDDSKKRANQFWSTGERKFKKALMLAERIRKAERVGKNCQEIVLGITTKLHPGDD